MYRVTREIRFCYGHRLLDYNGRCQYLHGHNGRALLTIEGPELDRRGMLADFVDIKRSIGDWIDKNLDHHTVLRRDDPLREVLEAHGQQILVINDNPTAETLAKLLFDVATQAGFPVVEVQFWETDSSFATFGVGQFGSRIEHMPPDTHRDNMVSAHSNPKAHTFDDASGTNTQNGYHKSLPAQ